MLQTQTVQPIAFALLKELMGMDVLKDFSLVGGTALSLKYGHRISVDLDLFSTKEFDPSFIVAELDKKFENRLQIESKSPKWGIFCYIDDVKVDMVNYPHPQILSSETEDGVRLYATPDIAAMKINAILGRGKKKDFWDLAELLKHYSIAEIIKFHKQKYPAHNLLITIPQAITYFTDADESEDPVSLKGQTWESVKK